MFIHHEDQDNFRRKCRNEPCFDYYYNHYDDLTPSMDDEYCADLYNRIEDTMVIWVKENITGNVFYSGDLRFYFEDASDRDLFDEEFGDEVGFKLRFL